MLGDLYEYVKTTIVGDVPMEFDFIIPIIVIIYCILIVYCVLSGFIIMNDFIKGRKK